MSSIFIKIISKLVPLKKHKVIQTLAKIEYGNAIFCYKLEKEALKENRQQLALMLNTHAKEEDSHGKMLAAIADGKNRISRTGLGRWVKIFRGEENILKSYIEPTTKPKILEWDSTAYPGEKLTGVLESFDGMSYRYLCLRLLFRNHAAFEHPWEDRLAFMYVLEEELAAFYQELSYSKDATLRSLASKMAGDEFNHANHLKVAIGRFVGFPDEIIQKWRNRLLWAKWALIIDVIWYFIRY